MITDVLEEVSADPEVDELVERIRSMSIDERFADIFRHEKEVRGIDWLEYAQKGADGIQEARHKAFESLLSAKSDLGVYDTDLPELAALLDPDAARVQIMPAWGINENEAAEWKAASGQRLADMISFRLKIMQSLELSSSPGAYAQIGLTIGVVVWLKRAHAAYAAAKAAGFTTLSAVAQGIRAVTLNATKLFVAGVVVAIIAEVLLFMMQKQAVVYMVALNMTDEDLDLEGVAVVNGKQTVQFVDPSHTVQRNRLNQRTVIDLPDEREVTYWMGIFSAQKRDFALIGTLGAFNFKPTRHFPQSVYVGWEIPLAAAGGPNRCLVSADSQRNNAAFASQTRNRGTLHSTSTRGSGKVTGTMSSRSGSEGYMAVIFEQV